MPFFVGCASPFDKLRTGFTQPLINSLNFSRRIETLVHPLDFEKSFINRTVKKAQDIDIYLASVDDIIKMKEFSGRSQDLSDIEMLKKLRKYLEEEHG